MRRALAVAAAIVMATVAQAQTGVPIEASGPDGALSGTYLPAGPNGGPVVLVIPGSGPTDRDGNNPLGVKAASLKLLAEGLAAQGIASVRIDKRGMFGSRAAVADANAVTIADYAADVRVWAAAVRAKSGARCVWVLGHSEGGLVALAADQASAEGICGVVLVAAPGRRLGTIMREQLRANPANAPILDQALGAIEALEKGQRVDVAAMHPALAGGLFAPQVQAYLIDLLRYDPAKLVATARGPVAIVSGARDIQVAAADAEALAAARPDATATVVPDMTHVLKVVASDDRTANIATYADPALPLAPGLVEAIAAFVKRPR